MERPPRRAWRAARYGARAQRPWSPRIVGSAEDRPGGGPTRGGRRNRRGDRHEEIAPDPVPVDGRRRASRFASARWKRHRCRTPARHHDADAGVGGWHRYHLRSRTGPRRRRSAGPSPPDLDATPGHGPTAVTRLHDGFLGDPPFQQSRPSIRRSGTVESSPLPRGEPRLHRGEITTSQRLDVDAERTDRGGGRDRESAGVTRADVEITLAGDEEPPRGGHGDVEVGTGGAWPRFRDGPSQQGPGDNEPGPGCGVGDRERSRALPVGEQLPVPVSRCVGDALHPPQRVGPRCALDPHVRRVARRVAR